MLKAIQIVITLLIVASLILQILVLLGNYRGLRNVNIIRVELNNPAATTGSNGFFGGLLDKFQDTVDGQIPDFITIALFIICQGDKERETVCTPATFGFRYGKKKKKREKEKIFIKKKNRKHGHIRLDSKRNL